MDHEDLIIERVKNGESEAFDEIVDKYKNKILNYLLGMTNNLQDAQDLTQEVFIKAYFALSTYRHTSSFSSWLYRIATNTFFDSMRKGKKMSMIPYQDEQMVNIKTPEMIYMEKEETASLQHYISLLPEEYRVVFLLRHVEELRYKEISQILEIPLASVQIRLYRARKKLSHYLKEAAKEEGYL